MRTQNTITEAKAMEYVFGSIGRECQTLLVDLHDRVEGDGITEVVVSAALLSIADGVVALSAPAWHMDEPVSRLLRLADEWPRVAFGISGAYWQVGSEGWERRADEAFNEVSRRHRYLPWLHLLRGLDLAGDRWPFASADSTNVARNFKSSQVCPERMARRLDAVQTPVSWSARATQGALLLVVA
jgi:hypothetical protein